MSATPIGSVSHATPVFHITHVENIASMARTGQLHCDSECAADENVNPVSIAYEDLKLRRSQWRVDKAQGGTLADYVPFYYAPRSPMLYVISRGYVSGYAGGQAEVAHLVCNAQELARPGEFVITDGHAATPLTTQFDQLNHLDQVDWQVMQSRYWFDTDDDGDRKRRRQAEFLVWRSVPFDAVRAIGVMTATVADRVSRALAGAQHTPELLVRPRWYY